MPDTSTIPIGFLNVVASPHPQGIYHNALQQASLEPVQYRGRDWAIIKPPSKSQSDTQIYEGQICVWTDVNPEEPSIDKTTFQEEIVGDNLKKVFEKQGFNNRTFSYALDENTHKIAIELKNELGKTLSIHLAGKIFQKALERLNTGETTYEVTVQPTEDALKNVLDLHRIDKISILLKRPNPGDHRGDDAEQILRELDDQKLKSAVYQFNRQPGTDGIKLNSRNLTRASVAAENGNVQSSGLNENEQKVHRSTKEYPLVIQKIIDKATSHLIAIRDEVKRFRAT
ncbi:DUF4747 family protein [Novosphingobium decolorationis]|uniref:DUF4747 family protein n=1 Tax=Novosphingobium decolorationis TaxID=2698673 RepID=A0ABX8E323_9SPHN|nr:DUF4747 family protein [Novosphingobium decolorationis]QVM83323.1 DUF4747 family protein [Novosphingobium decolorationis]